MAQIIKHRRGGLESVSGATKRAGELLVITGSSGISAGNGDGLLFIGIDGSTVTPANKILTGSSTPDLTGGSYDTSIDGLPFYNTSTQKLYILAKGGNTEVKSTANTDGTGIVSSSAQIDTLGFLQVNGDAVVSSSAQISGYNTFLEINGDSVVSSSAQISGYNTFLEINGMGVVSGSGQLTDMTGDITVDASGVSSISSGVIVDADVNASAAIAYTKINFNGSGITSGSLNLSIAGDSGTDTVTVGQDTFTFAGTANEIETSVSDNQVTIGLVTNPTIGGNLTISGNLTVSGTTTTVDSTTVNIGDNIIELNGTGAAFGGIMIGDVTAPNQVSGSLLWDATNDYWIAGASGSESKVLLAGGDNVVSGSAQVKALLPDGTISGSSQVDADSITNFDSNVKDKLNADGVISGSSQLLAGSGIVSSSAQISAYNTFLEINGMGVVSSSAQVVSLLDSEDVNLGGISGSSLDITGNAKIDGNLVLGGNITIGDATSDTISFGGEISSDIIPDTNNTHDLGSSSKKFAEVHATTIFGSISATNGVVSGSAQVKSLLPAGTVSGSSQVTGIVNSQIDAAAAIEYTKIDFNGSGITSGSLNLSIAGDSGTDTVTVGSDTFTFAGTANEIETSVTNNQVQIGLVDNPTLTGNVTITGNLSVEGTTTTIDSTTVQIGDRILELNYGGAAGNAGLLVSDAVGGTTVSGSLLWDATNDKWIGGALGSEKELARLNSAPTTNTVLKADGSGLLVDSLITDDGTNVTISGTAELRINGATANSFVYFDSNKSLEAVTPSTAGDVIQWNGSSFVASNELDGGTF